MYGTAIHLLSNALFMYDESHIADLKEYLVSKKALTQEQAGRLSWKYIKTHLPGHIPKKDALAKRFAYAWSIIRTFRFISR